MGADQHGASTHGGDIELTTSAAVSQALGLRVQDRLEGSVLLECDISVPHQFEPCDKGAGESDLKPARPIGNGCCEGRQAPLQRQIRGLLLKQRCDTQHGIGDAPEVRLRRTVSR